MNQQLILVLEPLITAIQVAGSIMTLWLVDLEHLHLTNMHFTQFACKPFFVIKAFVYMVFLNMMIQVNLQNIGLVTKFTPEFVGEFLMLFKFYSCFKSFST